MKKFGVTDIKDKRDKDIISGNQKFTCSQIANMFVLAMPIPGTSEQYWG